MTSNEGNVYAVKLKEFCIGQYECLGCQFFDKSTGCKVGTPIGWELPDDKDADVFQTDLFEAGWKEGFGMGKQELAHRITKLLVDDHL